MINSNTVCALFKRAVAALNTLLNGTGGSNNAGNSVTININNNNGNVSVSLSESLNSQKIEAFDKTEALKNSCLMDSGGTTGWLHCYHMKSWDCIEWGKYFICTLKREVTRSISGLGRI